MNETPETPDTHEVPIEDTIDLHPFHARDVAAVVEEYLYQAVRKGFREVRIIHGRGIGVQREIVRSILGKHPSVADFRDMPDRGSTLATLGPGPERALSVTPDAAGPRIPNGGYAVKETALWTLALIIIILSITTFVTWVLV
jgi:hypothetical protein